MPFLPTYRCGEDRGDEGIGRGRGRHSEGYLLLKGRACGCSGLLTMHFRDMLLGYIHRRIVLDCHKSAGRRRRQLCNAREGHPGKEGQGYRPRYRWRSKNRPRLKAFDEYGTSIGLPAYRPSLLCKSRLVENSA